MKNYYVHINSGNSVFVKEESFFIHQGGLTQLWGKAWRKINAESIEEARKIAFNQKLCIN